MITFLTTFLPVITTLLGVFSSALPAWIKYLDEKQRLKFNLQMATLQFEATVRNIEATKEIEKLRQAMADVNSARDADRSSVNDTFMDKLRSSVRPVITYSLFALFFGVKLMIAATLLKEGLNLDTAKAATQIILDDTTISMITVVVGFYFGNRAMNELRK